MQTTAVDPGALLNALQGRWAPVYQEIDGQMLPPANNANHEVELQGNEFKVELNGRVAYDGTFTIGPLGSTLPIVLTYRTSATPLFLGGTRAGVFQLEGDTLKWCFGAVGHPGPTGLNTFPGSESVLTILHRQRTGATATATAAAAVTRSILGGVRPW